MSHKFELKMVVNAPARNKVQCIKSIRMITCHGLKEAKDLVDAADEGKTITFTEHTGNREYPYDLDRELSYIRGSGYSVIEVGDIIAAKIKNLIQEVIDLGDYTLVKDLISILEKRK